jgi:hypothetical protein
MSLPVPRPGFLSISVDGQQVSTYVPNINVLRQIVLEI